MNSLVQIASNVMGAEPTILARDGELIWLFVGRGARKGRRGKAEFPVSVANGGLTRVKRMDNVIGISRLVGGSAPRVPPGNHRGRSEGCSPTGER